MKAPEWDEQLFEEHRDYIEVEEVRRAFDFLTAAAFETDLYSVQNSGVGPQKKSFTYDEPQTNQRPFAFIVNRGHLLFYIRRAGLMRFPEGIRLFKKSFAAVNENPHGEWTIRIETLKDAKRIQAIALDSENGEESNSTFDLMRKEADDVAEQVIEERRDIGPVEKEQLIRARRGQGRFRQDLEGIEPGCRLTQVTDRGHLRASHIKPWSKADDCEKLDPNNGLLLSPHIDHLFDRGYISFTDGGDLMVSRYLDPSILGAWGVKSRVNVGKFGASQCVYLNYHRRYVFRSS